MKPGVCSQTERPPALQSEWSSPGIKILSGVAIVTRWEIAGGGEGRRSMTYTEAVAPPPGLTFQRKDETLMWHGCRWLSSLSN